jgi:hypothetical protein
MGGASSVVGGLRQGRDVGQLRRSWPAIYRWVHDLGKSQLAPPCDSVEDHGGWVTGPIPAFPSPFLLVNINSTYIIVL